LRQVATHEILAELWISGRNWDPNECTASIGLGPTRTWQGKPFLRARVDLDTDAWVMGAPKRESYSIDEVVREVVDRYITYASIRQGARHLGQRRESRSMVAETLPCSNSSSSPSASL